MRRAAGTPILGWSASRWRAGRWAGTPVGEGDLNGVGQEFQVVTKVVAQGFQLEAAW